MEGRAGKGGGERLLLRPAYDQEGNALKKASKARSESRKKDRGGEKEVSISSSR